MADFKGVIQFNGPYIVSNDIPNTTAESTYNNVETLFNLKGDLVHVEKIASSIQYQKPNQNNEPILAKRTAIYNWYYVEDLKTNQHFWITQDGVDEVDSQKKSSQMKYQDSSVKTDKAFENPINNMTLPNTGEINDTSLINVGLLNLFIALGLSARRKF